MTEKNINIYIPARESLSVHLVDVDCICISTGGEFTGGEQEIRVDIEQAKTIRDWLSNYLNNVD